MLRKVYFLLWKNLLMRKNHYIATALEILLPTLMIVLSNFLLPKEPNEIDNDPIEFEKFRDGKCVPRHSLYGTIMYEPSTPFTDTLILKAACYAGYKKSSVHSGNLSDESIYFSIGVKFDLASESSNTVPDNLNYTLFPTNKVWENMMTLWRHSGTSTPRYSIRSVHEIIEFQRAIDTSYLYLRNISVGKISLENTDLFQRGPRVFSGAIHFSLLIAFSLMVLPIVSRIVQEKSTGAKELMLMMGVEKWQLWVSKFVDVVLVLVISMSGVVLFLFVPLKEDANTLKISGFILWFVIMYGLCGVIFFLFFLSCFFDNPTVAVYVTEILWFLSAVFGGLVSYLLVLPGFVKHVMCLFPPFSLEQGVSILLDFDFYGKSVRFTESLSKEDDSLCLLNVLFFMAFNMPLYAALTWYLEQVKPGKFGVPQPYDFCFKKSYWISSKVVSSSNNNCSNNIASFEPVPANLRVGVSIQNVSKVYKTPDKGIITAVDCISLDFYHSEISALLGHNGAGKTTVFSMITGMAYPTSGKVTINGYDLAANITEARRSLGLCPQHDMLFNGLTTEQTLKFYGLVKGLTLKRAKEEAAELIEKLKLTEVKNTQACKLSGGQKRKVSLAIALIGGSEVLVLDEPTSGMDPEIRREIWEILLGFRGSRTILLTTHFMEEADALCDRIAVMDHGKIKCYGSPMFLKSKYGKGYVLNVVVLDLDTARDVVEYVKSFVPKAKFKSQNIRTLSFEIPETDVNAFPALLTGLEEKQTKSEIASYCISLSTLEDVFLRLRSGHEERDDFDVVDSSPYKQLQIADDVAPPKASSFYLSFVQLWALLVKKWILFLKSYKTFLGYTVTPILLIALVSFLSRDESQTSPADDLTSWKPLEYSLRLYPSSTVPFSDLENPVEKQLFSELVSSYGSEPLKVKDVRDAIGKTFEKDFHTYSKKINLAVEFTPEEWNVLHNHEAVHMIPAALNLVHNFLLKLRFRNSSIETFLSARFANKESYVPPRITSKCNVEDLPDFSGTQTLFYLFGPVQERFHGAKGIQLMITSSSLYWLSHLLFDVISFFAYILIVALGVGFSHGDDFMLEHAGEILPALLLWGCGLVLLSYAISTLLKDVATAFIVNVVTYIVFTFLIYNVISIEGLPKCFQYLHPTCILKFGFNDLCNERKSNYIGILFLYDWALFLFLIVKDSKLLAEVFHRVVNKLVKVDYFLEVRNEFPRFKRELLETVWSFPQPAARDAKDEYVEEEERTVKKLITTDNISASELLVSELKRWYYRGSHPVPAVRGISFAVNRGECFGLLGVNGAGKTSSFKMLTGGLPLSHGSAHAHSERLSTFNRQKYLRFIGYCPQTGGLIPTFTGRELLRFFGRLRGVEKFCIAGEVRKWLEKMNLLEYADQECGTYSGGNQRKISTAIALIGDCPLVFLDEPTSGVDPLSRRAIWNAIETTQKEGQSVVLTSHSMDECEALCSRLAIMVSGRFRCIGETTTLKDRFGQGYCVQMKLTNGASEMAVSALKKSVLTAFGPDCELIDEHLTVLQYHVRNRSLSWAELFSKLGALKETFGILESYTASATTLEQIFIYFARNQ